MKLFKIEENDANQRLDKFLKKLFPNATRSLIYKLNRKGKIKVDWKKKDNEYKLVEGEEIKIFLRDEDFDELIKKQEIKEEIKDKLEKKDIMFEDWDMLAINKNPWINVHPAWHKTKEVSLIEQVWDYIWWKKDSLTFKPSLAHRIDRDTSGIIIIWKKKNTLEYLTSAFKNHTIRKRYFALVIWKLENKKWKIDKKILRLEKAVNENKVRIDEEGQKALTLYEVVWEYSIKTKEWDLHISALEVEIKTWRMHQIRLHMQSIWHPIIWDKTYWDKKINWFLEKNYNISRQMLHSYKIDLFYPPRDKNISLNAKLKKDMQDFIDKIK